MTSTLSASCHLRQSFLSYSLSHIFSIWPLRKLEINLFEVLVAGCIVNFGLMKHHTLHYPEPDLLVEPGLVKHGVFEVDGVSVAAELHIVTNCVDTQFQLPLRALDHRAARLRICLYHLHANIQNTCLLNYICGLVSLPDVFHIAINIFTLFFTCCSGAPAACLGELSHCTVFCRSSQSVTCSSGCWNSTWQTLHLIGWLVRVTGWLEQKVMVTSLEQPAWRCPTCKKKHIHFDHILRKQWKGGHSFRLLL